MFSFAWPPIFLLLPLIWLVQKFFSIKQMRNDVMLRIPFLSNLQTFHQETHPSILLSNVKQFYGFCTWFLLLIACANPRWIGEPLMVHQDGKNILLAVDVSPSMAIPDLERDDHLINRLQSVKKVAADFIDKREGDKLGLILFGSKAYIQTPLTFDRKTVHSMLDDATIGLAGRQTAIGDTLGLAVKKFESENIKSRILILLTDGGNNTGLMDPIMAAQLAKQNKIKIYTVGIGASKLEISNGFGTQTINPSAELDETMLKNIAQITEGQYFRALDLNALTNILESINKLEPVSLENKTVRPITALFYCPLALALIFFTLMIFPTQNMRRQQ